MIDLKLRKKGIGGSEIGAILGLSEHSSPYRVWAQKTGREPAAADNKFMVAGRFLESAVSDYFESVTECRIIKASADQQTFTHPTYSFVMGTPDRLYIAKNMTGRGVLECKTTQKQIDEIPMTWFCQLQWYLGLMERKYGAIAWLERGIDFKYQNYEFDTEFFDFMLTKASEFWNNHVVTDIPPDPINVDDVTRIFRRSIKGKTVTANELLVAAHKELVEIRQSISVLETRKEELENQLKLEMKDAEALITGVKILATWKTAKPSVQLDKDRFKTEWPELYDSYCREVEGSRRFLVKGA